MNTLWSQKKEKKRKNHSLNHKPFINILQENAAKTLQLKYPQEFCVVMTQDAFGLTYFKILNSIN